MPLTVHSRHNLWWAELSQLLLNVTDLARVSADSYDLARTASDGAHAFIEGHFRADPDYHAGVLRLVLEFTRFTFAPGLRVESFSYWWAWEQLKELRSVEFGEEGDDGEFNARDLEIDDVNWALDTSLLATVLHSESIAHRLRYDLDAADSLCPGHIPLDLLRLRQARLRSAAHAAINAAV